MSFNWQQSQRPRDNETAGASSIRYRRTLTYTPMVAAHVAASASKKAPVGKVSIGATASAPVENAAPDPAASGPAAAAAVPSLSPPDYADVEAGRRRTVVYGLIDLDNKTNQELQNMMLMADRLKLSRMWTVCAEILEDRHQNHLLREEARRAATMSRLQSGLTVQIDPVPLSSLPMGDKRQQQSRSFFVAGVRKRGKMKD